MIRSIPPRLRAPLTMLAGGAVIAAFDVAGYGWRTLLVLGPITVVAAAGYYVWGGRDGDFAHLLRHRGDERQEYRRLKTQALVGKVTSGVAVVAYLAAFAAKATMWPFDVFILVPAATFRRRVADLPRGVRRAAPRAPARPSKAAPSTPRSSPEPSVKKRHEHGTR